MPAWMESEGHRENLLNCTWVHIGIGVAFRDTRGSGSRTLVGPDPFVGYHLRRSAQIDVMHR